ncbi:uncharacterized protein LOC111006085 isoform X2 [Momordica charantia]|uniref:Uncharacterized protein LOC111006085 isoform X2 n=1 Tax=Momordica charantia TaxID=3673 RepID=A0A6J1BVJ1_MOMCH|nr:uncharacterized protein LOC111006085 isoform X2 [Momordica charantia]XP_022133540.1 uncharacterized protein LOC111006085 isoform X2 [Momordica charantia]
MAQQRRVVIQNNHGEKLVGILHDTGSDELVIVCHGFQSSKERIPMVNLAAAFDREGISVFRFDFAGNGESEGLFQYGNYRREADDLRAVVQHFRGNEHTITAIIGHSKGGNVVLLYASKYGDIHIVVNISGRFNLERGIEGRLGRDFLQRIKQEGFIDVKNRRGKFEYRVTEESLMDRLTTDVRASCLSIHGDCRVMTVHGSMDEIVPADDALEFSKSIANHDLCIIERADHDYTSHQGELASVVVNFVKENLHLHKDMSKLQLCRMPDKGGRSRL